MLLAHFLIDVFHFRVQLLDLAIDFMSVALIFEYSAQLFHGHFVGKQVLQICLQYSVFELRLNFFQRKLLVDLCDAVGDSTRYVSHVCFEGKASIELALVTLCGEDAFEFSDGESLGPDDITDGFERQLDDVLNVSPFIGSSQKILNDRWSVWIQVGRSSVLLSRS